MNDSQVYFIWGLESFLIDLEIKKIITRVQQEADEEPEVVYLDADNMSPVELMEQLEFSPLFNLQRVVVIKRPPWLTKSKRKNSKVNDIVKILGDYLQKDSCGQVLIITADEHDGSNPVVKLLDKNVAVFNVKAATSKMLSGWVKDEFARRNCKITSQGVHLLANSGQDMYYLQNLIEKVSLAAENSSVTESDIEEQLSSKDEIKVFKLTDALLSRNLKASFQAYYKLLDQGQHPVFFLYMIVRQFILLGKVKYYLEKGYNKTQIVNETGIKEFTARKMINNAGEFTSHELQEMFNLFLQADVSFKTTGRDAKIVMEMLIIDICSR